MCPLGLCWSFWTLVPEWALTRAESCVAGLEAWQWQRVSSPALSLCMYQNNYFFSCPLLSCISNSTLLLPLEKWWALGGVQKEKWDCSAWLFPDVLYEVWPCLTQWWGNHQSGGGISSCALCVTTQHLPWVVLFFMLAEDHVEQASSENEEQKLFLPLLHLKAHCRGWKQLPAHKLCLNSEAETINSISPIIQYISRERWVQSVHSEDSYFPALAWHLMQKW